MKLKKEPGTNKGKYEKVERILVYATFGGAVLLAVGIGLSILTPKGLPAVIAMLGAFISFVSTAGLIFTWLFKELFGE